jgi:hypothetical protein
MILKGSVFHCSTGRTRGLWWASPSLGRHSERGQAEEGFYNVRAGLFLFFIYNDFQYIGDLWGGVHYIWSWGFIVWSDCVLVIYVTRRYKRVDTSDDDHPLENLIISLILCGIHKE